MQDDTRTLLRTGLGIFATGALAAVLLLTAFGGISKQGPHTNPGWLALILAIGCLPMGLLLLLLAALKMLGTRRS